MVEHCARYVNKDPAMLRALEARAAISVFSRDWVDIEEMGLTRISSSSSSLSSSRPVSHELSGSTQPRRDGPIIEEVAGPDRNDDDVAMPEQPGLFRMMRVNDLRAVSDLRREVPRPEIPDAAEQHVSVRVDRDSALK